ncbi:hypothetical protein [Scytonema millei]|uniref:Uncharacterized protein n=1 Tax=Scytonema millei VB511283 TaxID=1245923 RepID=A0A9X5I626_9CYAN|nr:hypothetical protein [Scytonema millei]NHC36062.1 hypothetical protein [Scytonema millei VB511283]
MQVLLNKSLQSLAPYTTENSRENLAVYAEQSRLRKSTCPCCSYILLRHIDLAGIYWRCSHCYQEMPVYQPQIAIAMTNQLKL